MIFVECKPDAVLVQVVTGLRRRDVIHEIEGKFGVSRQLSKRRNSRGLIDEDPAANQPKLLRDMSLRQHLPEMGLRLLEDTARFNRIVVLCPKLEEWMLRAAGDIGVSLNDYGLPTRPSTLHQVINEDLRKFERVIETLKESARLSALRRLLTL